MRECFTITTTLQKDRMCSFKAGPACQFDEAKYTVHAEELTYSQHKCFYGEQSQHIVCGCQQDLCNGNMTFMQSMWANTQTRDPAKHQCVETYLQSKASLDETKAENYDEVLQHEQGQHSHKDHSWIDPEKDLLIFLILLIVAIISDTYSDPGADILSGTGC
ncbi:hypothetical protein COOONC_21860 [Cooperia oncophora]